MAAVGGRTAAPDVLDQAVGADRLVRVQQQDGQQRALARATERQGAALIEDFERAEDAEVHGERCEPTTRNVPLLPVCCQLVTASQPASRRIAIDVDPNHHSGGSHG